MGRERLGPDEIVSGAARATIGPTSLTTIVAVIVFASACNDELLRDSRAAAGDAAGGSAGAASSGAGAGQSTFQDVTISAGLLYLQWDTSVPGACGVEGAGCDPESMTGGAAAGDYDDDGFIDLYVTRLYAPGILFRNRGDGSFADATAGSGLGIPLRANGAAWADIDGDSDLDLYVTTVGEERFYLFINEAGVFREDAVARGADLSGSGPHIGFSVGVGDYDGDGWLDLHTTEWRSTGVAAGATTSHARLLRNRGTTAPGFFDDVTAAAGVALEGVSPLGVFAFGSSFVDLDDDGHADLAIASDYGTSRLFWNDGDGTFSDGTATAGVGTDENGMGSAFGDYDGDGRVDWFVTSIFAPNYRCDPSCDWGGSGNRLYKNEDGRRFSDATDPAGVRDGGWGWGAAFLDYDNDGDLDLTMTNGSDLPSTPKDDVFDGFPMRLWRNEGGTMTDVAIHVGLTDAGQGRGLLVLDYDVDGDLDLLVVNNAARPSLYRNDGGNANGWLRVRLVGSGGNRRGIGSRVAVKPTPEAPALVREIGVGSHFLGQSEQIAHFGLGPGTGPVAEVRIRWPEGGSDTVLMDVARNQTLVVERP